MKLDSVCKTKIINIFLLRSTSNKKATFSISKPRSHSRKLLDNVRFSPSLILLAKGKWITKVSSVDHEKNPADPILVGALNKPYS